MKALGLAWLGIPTERLEPTVAFFRDVPGPGVEVLEGDFAKLRPPDGDAVEVFGSSHAGQERFAAGPVVGFRVGDVRDARGDLEAAGIEFIGPVHAGGGDGAWSRLRGPNDTTYEVVQLPDDEIPR